MSSVVPFRNAVAQNSLDFNNKNPTNKGGLFRYKINNYGAAGTHVFNVSDLNSICVFSGDVNVTLNPLNFSSLPPSGVEILFYSPNGRIRVDTASGASLYTAFGNFTSPGKLGKLIYTSDNKWFFSSLSATPFSIAYTDCCGSISATVYQVRSSVDAATFSPSRKTYADSDTTIPFNGIFQDPATSYYYNIVNGGSTPVASCDVPSAYSTPITFYTDATNTVTLYSSASLSPSSYISLLGYKFFTTDIGTPVYSCYSDNQVAPGSTVQYYGSTAQYPSDPVTFLNGYVINYNGIPYSGPY